MTLIIAIKCRDGIVVGADGAATLGYLGQNTIKQDVRKLTIHDGRLIIGVSGPVGLGQRIKGVIADMWDGKRLSGQKSGAPLKPYEAMTRIREEIWQHITQEMQAASLVQTVVGPVASTAALTWSVLAMPLANQATLFQFDQQGAPEEATEDLPFVAIGSGQKSADPFLAFIRRIFWTDGLPTLAEGTFATYWALDYAIKAEPGGIAEPVQMAILKREGASWKASELGEAELLEHRQSIQEAEKSLRAFRESLAAPKTGEPASSPPAKPTA